MVGLLVRSGFGGCSGNDLDADVNKSCPMASNIPKLVEEKNKKADLVCACPSIRSYPVRPSMATTFTGYPPYGTYQAPYPIYSIPPGQPMAAGAAAAAAALPHFFPQPPPGYPLYALQPAKAPSPPPAPPTAPDIPTISPQIASNQVRKLIVSQLKIAEFESIDPHALHRLELEVVACKSHFASSCLSKCSFSVTSRTNAIRTSPRVREFSQQDGAGSDGRTPCMQ